MTEKARNERNAARLLECWPAFGKRVLGVIGALEQDGFRPRIQDAWRSPAAQQTAFLAGHSKLRYGFHNVTGAGGKSESLAVDLIDDDHPLASTVEYCVALAHHAAKFGLLTGILWGLPANLQVAATAAIQCYGQVGDLSKLKIGWDPTHIEPLGIKVSEARSGKRPK